MKKEIEESSLEYYHFCSQVIGLNVLQTLKELEVRPEVAIGVVTYAFDRLISSLALRLGLDPNKAMRDIASCMIKNNPPTEDISHDMEAIIKEAERIMNGKREE